MLVFVMSVFRGGGGGGGGGGKFVNICPRL